MQMIEMLSSIIENCDTVDGHISMTQHHENVKLSSLTM